MRLTQYGWDAWPELRELMDLHTDFNRVFDGWATGHDGKLQPPVNAWVNDNGVVVDVELPGVDPATVDVSVVGNTLTVAGKRVNEAPETAKFYIAERPAGDFKRSLELPYGVESDKVTAHYANGVLRISLPRLESDKPRRIQIQAA